MKPGVQIVAGCRMPSDAGILAGDLRRDAAAKDGCDRLLAAIRKLQSKEAKHG